MKGFSLELNFPGDKENWFQRFCPKSNQKNPVGFGWENGSIKEIEISQVIISPYPFFCVVWDEYKNTLITFKNSRR